MSSTGRVDEGMVTHDDTTIDDGNDDLGYLTDTDPEICAESIWVLRMADALLVANGRGTRAERQASRRRELEDDLNGGMEEEEWGGRNADKGVVAERDEVEDERGGGEDAAAGEAEFLMFESAVNQFLLAAPMKPEILGKDAWPVVVAPPSRMSVAVTHALLIINEADLSRLAHILLVVLAEGAGAATVPLVVTHHALFLWAVASNLLNLLRFQMESWTPSHLLAMRL